MSEENIVSKPEGKGLAITGFILALVGIVFNVFVMGAALLSGNSGLAWFWVVLCAAGAGFSAMGMMKLGKTGGKKGLAIAGLVIGIIAVIWSAMGAMAVGEAADAVGGLMQNLDTINDAMQNIEH